VSITKSTLFAVSKDEWDKKEDPSKSMKNALCVQRYGKRHALKSVLVPSESLFGLSFIAPNQCCIV